MDFNGVRDAVIKKLGEKRCVLLYAFNGVGKTRLSVALNDDEDSEDLEVLCYNAFFEDYFVWNNEECSFGIRSQWLAQLIKDEGLDRGITKLFMDTIQKNVEPDFSFSEENGDRVFFYCPNSTDDKGPFKISRGEETLFKWSVFCVILQNALEQLSMKAEDRSTNLFDKLRLIIIDDPISSLDDYKTYGITECIINIIRKVRALPPLSLLVTTHHAAFFCALNSNSNRLIQASIMTFAEGEWSLKNAGASPLTTHICMFDEIKRAIASKMVAKKHFNMFRSVVEKTAVFLGRGGWFEMFNSYPDREKLKMVIDGNSHCRYSELEITTLPAEHIECFENGFKWFGAKYGFPDK